MKFHRLSTSTAETSEYEGEYEGVRVRLTRHGGRRETRWDGFVWDDRYSQWSLVAECYPSMQSAAHEAQRWIKEGPLR